MLQFNFIPFPILVTDRLIMRQLEHADENEIFAIRTNNSVNNFLERTKPESISQAREFINRINQGIANAESIYWGISEIDQPKIIGTICYWNIEKEKKVAEIGFELHPAFQGKGIMREVFPKVLEYGFKNMSLKRIEGYVHKDNIKSSKLLEEFHFKKETNLENKSKEVIYTLANNTD
jgi:ribosomal-protein-alanine N-acetyltransferase